MKERNAMTRSLSAVLAVMMLLLPAACVSEKLPASSGAGAAVSTADVSEIRLPDVSDADAADIEEAPDAADAGEPDPRKDAEGSIAALLEGVPLPKDGVCLEAVNAYAGKKLGVETTIAWSEWVPQQDMILTRYGGITGEQLDAYIDELTASGFTYGVCDQPDIYIAYNAETDGVGVQIQNYYDNEWQITIFRQLDGCYGLREELPKG